MKVSQSNSNYEYTGLYSTTGKFVKIFAVLPAFQVLVNDF